MTPGLQLAPGLTLPIEAVTQTFAIVAMRGAGKTYLAKVLVESMLAASLRVCVLDPLGVFWGLRSSADGRHPGEPVVIFGGDHADVPLEHTAGELLADLVVDEQLAAVLDLSAMSKKEGRIFVATFAERLYRRNRSALHLVLDEADTFVPQRGAPDTARCAAAIDDIARRGRVRGLGLTMTTQRSAVLSKDVLSQAENLIAMRMSSPRDIASIDDWVRHHTSEEQAASVKASLPSLPVGTAWVWSPGWLGILKQIKVRKARTFDSSATPLPGQIRVEPKRMAPVDLEQLGQRIGATLERAKAEDPRELRAQIADLQRQLRAQPKPETIRIDVPVISAADRDQIVQTAQATRDCAADHLQAFTELVGRLGSITDQLQVTTTGETLPREAAQRPANPPSPQLPPARITATKGAPLSAVPRTEPRVDRVVLKAGARRMLEVLARIQPLQVTRAQLATLARMKVTGGTFGTYYSTLRRNGFLSEVDGGLLALTDAGREAVGAQLPTTPLDPQAVREQWRAVLKAGARTMLDALVDAWPQPITRADLAAAADLEPSGGTFGTYLSTLRRNGLAVVDGDQVKAAEVLFLGAG